ncbi:hypothetical protein DFA_01837 [Cavenderia fasciculata]|uniref:SWIM-type domain-containing protein n=1 Tax=Cavenderia fasciculata TaxID=261658 RepID=F4PUY9_CACFS|nr:uncharacterized protein DFA_01837 [Cavenderia fasciculata]EGG21951.1 hypothetical protein DFA_01837 [Cavenderia fasciculata]|eukprot:XP_004359802.1 hypothetical protein DFA_01837 [Cavenderia fasciculata]
MVCQQHNRYKIYQDCLGDSLLKDMVDWSDIEELGPECDEECRTIMVEAIQKFITVCKRKLISNETGSFTELNSCDYSQYIRKQLIPNTDGVYENIEDNLMVKWDDSQNQHHLVPKQSLSNKDRNSVLSDDGGGYVSTRCTCPVGRCKHIKATAIAMYHRLQQSSLKKQQPTPIRLFRELLHKLPKHDLINMIIDLNFPGHDDNDYETDDDDEDDSDLNNEYHDDEDDDEYHKRKI